MPVGSFSSKYSILNGSPSISDTTCLINEALWPTANVTFVNPKLANRRRVTSRIEMSPSGKSGLGKIQVYGRRRVPSPPTKIIASIMASIYA